jgi:uncharacterized protein with FMN-binding domain
LFSIIGAVVHLFSVSSKRVFRVVIVLVISALNQDTTNNPLEMPDNPNKRRNEKIRNKDGNNQEYESINHPIANCKIKIKRTVDLPDILS